MQAQAMQQQTGHGQAGHGQAGHGQSGQTWQGQAAGQPGRTEALAWESFAWRSGAEDYRFEIKDHGMIGSLSVSDGRKFVLPVVVWEALFDAVKTNRRAKSQSRR